jgi:hypothetical protein
MVTFTIFGLGGAVFFCTVFTGSDWVCAAGVSAVVFGCSVVVPVWPKD